MEAVVHLGYVCVLSTMAASPVTGDNKQHDSVYLEFYIKEVICIFNHYFISFVYLILFPS